jgi:hypothetical protein
MGNKVFGELLSSLDGIGADIPDEGRRKGFNWKYQIQDAVQCAFAVFFFAYASLLNFQRKMKQKERRSNLESMLGVKEIPCDNEIRKLVDKIDPEKFRPAFKKNLDLAEREGALGLYKTRDGELLMALDGTWYYSSTKIHCEHCLHKTTKDKKGNDITTWFHSALCAVIVNPHTRTVIPVMPETITNKDGEKKQDCELEAGKRWLRNNKKDLTAYKIVILGDDLYSNDPFCREILRSDMHFMLTCKPDSHKWLMETVNNSDLQRKREIRHEDGKHRTFIYQWINGVPLREASPSLTVNYFTLRIIDRKTGKQRYYNSWITDKPIDENNVGDYADYARARWKIENEHNNVLKNHGYNLKHNFGHGKKYASEVFFILQLLAFQFHSILDRCDALWWTARQNSGRRDSFFAELALLFGYQLFDSWDAFIQRLASLEATPDS